MRGILGIYAGDLKMKFLTVESFFDAAQNVAETAEKKDASEILDSVWKWLVEFATSTGVDLIVAAIILIVGFKIVKLLVTRMKSSDSVLKMEPTVRTFLTSLLNIGGKLIVIISAATVLGLPTTSVVTVVGSCGLAVGLALQGSLSNIAGGFIILVFKPFVVGDYIIAGSNEGTVKDIGIFYTKINTGDNKLIIVPNSVISNAEVANLSKRTNRRVDIEISVSYDSDIDTVKAILQSVCEQNELVLSEPSPEVHLISHGSDALVFTMRTWCLNNNYWAVYFDLMESSKKALDNAGIEIPYKQLDVHMK